MPEDVVAIVDEVCDAQLGAVFGLLVAFAAEAQVFFSDPGPAVEVVVFEPLSGALLDARSGFGDEPDAALEEFDECGDHIEHIFHGRGFKGLAGFAVQEGGILGCVGVARADQNASDVDSKSSLFVHHLFLCHLCHWFFLWFALSATLCRVYDMEDGPKLFAFAIVFV